MTKIYSEVERHYIDRIVDKTRCDICKKEYNGSLWEREDFSASDTEVTLTIGNNYPEAGFGEFISFDICPDCFKNKLIPLLKKEFDAEPYNKEWER